MPIVRPRPFIVDRFRAVAFSLITVVLRACDALGITQECTTELRYGISVLVLDSIANGPIRNANSIVVKATDGAYSDSLAYDSSVPNPEGPIGLAPERAGRYTVSVRASGYEPWSSTVRVSKNDCHVEGQLLEARLRPLTPD